MKLKKIIQENAYLGELPSSKLLKMKWNPLTGKKSEVKEDKINEDYIEVMDIPVMLKHMMAIEKLWKNWKRGPLTKKSDIKPASKELKDYLRSWFSSKIK